MIKPRLTSRGIFGIILAGGIILRFFKLGSQSVWIDEYITANFAAGPNILHVFFDVLANNPHPPLFFILEHLACSVFGISEFSIRLLPALFGIFNIFLIYKLTRSFFPEKVSLIAAFLFAFNPYQVYYSQEARMYSMFLTTSLFIIYYFLMSIKYNTFLSKPFIVWSVAGLYTHNYTVLLLLVLNLLVFVKYKEDIRINLWTRAQVYILVFWAPLMLFFVKGITGGGYSHKVNILQAPVYTFKNFLFGITSGLNIWTGAALVAALFFIIIGAATKRKASEKKIIDIFTAIILIFIAVPWIESIAGKPVYSDRTLIICSALVLIVLAYGISYMYSTALTGFLAVIFIIYSVSLFNYFFTEQYQKIDYRSRYERVMKNIDENGVIIHSSVNSYSAFEFYNRLKYKKNYPNRLISEIPEFEGGAAKMKIREMWRGFKFFLSEKLNIDIYAGYDRNILTQEELKKTASALKEVWFVRDDRKGIRQIWLPLGNVWYSDKDFGGPPKITEMWWVKKYFETQERYNFYGGDVSLMVRK